MDPYVVFLAGAGAVVLLLAWVPMLFRDLPLSLPIFCLMLGVVLFWWEPVGLRPDPLRWPQLTERLSELVVIVSLMGAGLKLDRPLGWRSWGVTWRLVAFTMPLSILAVALLGSHLLGLAPAPPFCWARCSRPRIRCSRPMSRSARRAVAARMTSASA